MPRRCIRIEGLVQGVGFRPFVYELAGRLGLSGFVKNQGGAVLIEVEGGRSALDRFLSALRVEPPPLARIDALHCTARPDGGETAFTIQPSDASAGAAAFVSPDLATCPHCLAELFDPQNRRYRYPFINCTQCGPRLTILWGVPYDRRRTSMASFPLCPDCRREYEEPADRRFHAQPIACWDCGPQLAARDARGVLLFDGSPAGIGTEGRDAVAFAAERLAAGQIGALKSLGGYHLACDARNAPAVAELRRRKRRDAKPLAVMVADREAARQVARISLEEERLLESPARPIVLVSRRPGIIADEVAPGVGTLGLMLPYTPFHHLLMDALNGVPLVMTSGNSSDEPIAYRDDEARQRLSGTADFFITHDRPIHRQCDDSVTRLVAGRPLPIRRSRGEAPQPIALPHPCSRPVLALGGQLKAVFALGRGKHAFVSQHWGDLDRYETYRAYCQGIDDYERLFQTEPEWIVHDLHPDYLSTRYAQERGGPGQRLAVQHHHAHLASCLAEHGVNEPALGVVFDGTGYGTDGAVWGGEFLFGDYRQCLRAAHFRYVPVPGGEQAIREPWRMACAHLIDAGRDCNWPGLDVPRRSVTILERMIARSLGAPMTSSAGRLFDAVAALAGVRNTVRYEGQAAIELERLAAETPAEGVYPFALETGPPLRRTGFQPVRGESGQRSAVSGQPVAVSGQRSAVSGWQLAADGWKSLVGESGMGSGGGNDGQVGNLSYGGNAEAPSWVIDVRPMIAAVHEDALAGTPAGLIARRFHSTMVEIVVRLCERLRGQLQIGTVVLSGGVFMNALLLEETIGRLNHSGFRVYRHERVPPNDGGLCLGQLAIAAAVS